MPEIKKRNYTEQMVCPYCGGSKIFARGNGKWQCVYEGKQGCGKYFWDDTVEEKKAKKLYEDLMKED